MENIKNTKDLFIFLTFIFILFFSPLVVRAIPYGTILYKTSEEGKMYGYNNYEFSLLTGKFNSGGVSIYIGKDRLNNNEPLVAEVDYNGVRIIPAKYFVDLDKGEKFIGAKIPKGFEKMSEQMKRNILNQVGENFDFTYHKQKGPQSGDWTPAGFVEKVFESAESVQLTYHQESIWNYPYYSAFNITPDGYDNESEINNNHDCFSENREFSKIHKLGQGGFFERFFTKEAKSLIQALQSSLSNAADEIINLNAFGKKYNSERYFFFPYTQFKQPTLREVEVDIPVASHGKAQAVGELSAATLLRLKTVAFSERIIRELTIERIKKLAQDFVGLGKIISAIRSGKETLSTAEEGLKLMSGGAVDINTEKFAKETASKNKQISAALSWLEETEEFVQAGIDESLEFFDMVNKGHLTGPEYERKMELELAKIDQIEEQVLGDTMSEPERFETIKKTISNTELSSLVDVLEKEIELGGIDFTEEKIEDIENLEKPLLSQYLLGDILINELVVNPAEGANEWIELYNTTDKQISLDNWTIEDNNAKPKSLKNLTINPKRWLILNQGQDFTFNLNNSGDIIKLKYKDRVIDSVAYGDFNDGNVNDNAPATDKGQSLVRKNNQDTNQDKNDWTVSTLPTPGMLNQIVAPVSVVELISQPQNSSGGGGGGGSSSPNYQAYQTGNVIINEIMYNPSGSDTGHEWIEIYNTTSENIDLTNWKFYEAETNHSLSLEQGSWILSVGGYAIIADNANQFLIDYPNFNKTLFKSSFSLNNISEKIIIKDGQGNPINELTYSNEWGGDGDGNSIEKKSDGMWEQSLSAGGTPGQKNSAKQSVVDTEGEEQIFADTISPVVNLTSYPNNPTTEIQAVFSFSASESAKFFCKLDANNWEENCSSPKTYANLSQTEHSFYIKAIDAANNESLITTYRWTVESEQEEIQEQEEQEQKEKEYQSYSFLDVVINEIAWMGTEASFNDEWIELYNNSNQVVDLSGWHLQADDGTPNITLSGQIPGNGYFLLERIDDTTINDIKADQIYTGALEDNGEYLQLKDSLGNIIDELNFSSIWPAGNKDTKVSMERISSLVSGNEITNWQNNNGQEIVGLDAQGNPIIGTPKRANSQKIEETDENNEETEESEESQETEEPEEESNEPEPEPDITTPVSNITSPITGKIFNATTWPGIIEGVVSSDNNLDKVEIQIQKGLETQYLGHTTSTNDLIWLDNPCWIEVFLEGNTTSSAANWYFDLPVSLLTEDNHYFIRSQAFDFFGNVQNPTSTVDFIFDATAPEKVTGLKIETEDTLLDFTLSWDHANDNLSGVDYYQIWDENNNWNSGNASSTDEVIANLTGESDTDYSFKVRACDKAGNCGEFSDPVAYTSPKIIKDIVIIRGDNQDYSIYIPTAVPDNVRGMRSEKDSGPAGTSKYGGAFWQRAESSAYTNFEFSYNPVDNGLTLGFWYYLPSLKAGGWQSEIIRVSGTDTFFQLFVVRPNSETNDIYYYVKFLNDDPDVILDMTPFSWSIGWNHLAIAVKSDKTVAFYYNGQLIDSDVVGSVNFNITKFYLYGFYINSVKYVYYDDVFLTAKGLTADRINDIYASGQPYNGEQ